MSSDAAQPCTSVPPSLVITRQTPPGRASSSPVRSCSPSPSSVASVTSVTVAGRRGATAIAALNAHRARACFAAETRGGTKYANFTLSKEECGGASAATSFSAFFFWRRRHRAAAQTTAQQQKHTKAAAATISPKTRPPIAGCAFPLSPPAPAAAPPAAAQSVALAPHPPEADPDCDGDDEGVSEPRAGLCGGAFDGTALEDNDKESDRNKDVMLGDGEREGNNDGGGGGGGARDGL